VNNQKTFELPTLPPSVNNIYRIDRSGHRRNRYGGAQVVYLSPEARLWKNQMQLLVPLFPIAEDSTLGIDYVAHYPLFHRNGKRRRVDCHNLMKLLFDTICAKIAVDDSRVVMGSFAACDDVNEKVVITLTEYVQPGN
jgi:Holliday junction resolvase RusA-like endonuclease